MPLPMVHLAVAMELHTLGVYSKTPEFLLGNLAPDAIHMRPGTDRDDKSRTHLVHDTPPEDFTPIQQLLDRYAEAEQPQADFAAGYAAHLLTDRWWVQQLLPTFRERAPASLSFAERRSLYYQDTDQIDFDLYHRMPWRPAVWQDLTHVDPADFPPLLAAAEIDQWRTRVIDWFGGLKEEPGITPTLITYQEVIDFIPQAAAQISHLFTEWGIR